MSVRGIRGAITVEEDQSDLVLSATQELLSAIQKDNPTLRKDDIASILFTVTSDLSSVYPAKAAREMGWAQIPLMCALEIPVVGSLKKCVRVLIHWNTELKQDEIRHVYLRDAVKLRPDLVSNRS
jgi:chorismate mutase